MRTGAARERRFRRRRAGVAGAATVVALAAVQLGAVVAGAPGDDPSSPGRTGSGSYGEGVDDLVRQAAYAGLGTWVDVYDFVPSYQPDGAEPPVGVDDVDEMAAAGVGTVYLQAAQEDPRTPGLVVDEALLGRFLARAHERGLQVVGWYLPRFDDLDRDLAHIEAIARFEADGHRFDGVAIDIEWTGSVPEHDVRSDRLVKLSRRARDAVGDHLLGAIVPAPVQLEVVNPGFWPRFPWDALADVYDVWLPMGYWTDRRADSGYRHAARYTEENVRRLRARVGDDALVHAIGGVGHDVTAEDLTGFVEALRTTRVLGGSVYDWGSLDPGGHARLAAAVRQAG